MSQTGSASFSDPEAGMEVADEENDDIVIENAEKVSRLNQEEKKLTDYLQKRDLHQAKKEQKAQNTRTKPVVVFNIEEIFKVKKRYIKELNEQVPEARINEIKFTANGNMLIYTESTDDVESIMQNDLIFNKSRKIDLNITKKKFFFVIKGLTYEEAVENQIELKAMGVDEINQIGKNKDLKIVKIAVYDKNAGTKMKKQGIKLNYVKHRVEDFIQHTKVLQCFKCQEFGHTSTSCKKEDTCSKCAGAHRSDSCKEATIKCSNCGENHSSAFYECQKYQDEINKKKEMIKKMAQPSSLKPEKTSDIKISAKYSDVVSHRQSDHSNLKLILEQLTEIKQSISNQNMLIQELEKKLESQAADNIRRMAGIEEKLNASTAEIITMKSSTVNMIMYCIKSFFPSKEITSAMEKNITREARKCGYAFKTTNTARESETEDENPSKKSKQSINV
jgi:hypothetical protein